MMHRVFLPGMAALALTLAVPAPVEAGGGGIGGGGMSLGGGSFGHAGFGVGAGGNLGHAGLVGPGSVNVGRMSSGIGGGRGAIGLGGSQLSTGLGLTRGIGAPGGDDLHLGLSSHDLGLGNNFGLNLPGNVLNRAARVPTSPLKPGTGLGAFTGRSNLKDFDLGIPGDGRHSSQAAKGSQASSGGPKTNAGKKEGASAGRSEATNLEGQLLLQQRLAAERQAELPTPTPASPPAPTTAVPQPTAPTLPDISPAVTTSLGSGEVQMIGAYFAEHGAPVASIPTSSVNVSVGGTVPESVALFPPPYDLASQVSGVDFSFFVWGNSVVVVDGQTDVVAAIIPDVLAHQD